VKLKNIDLGGLVLAIEDFNDGGSLETLFLSSVFDHMHGGGREKKDELDFEVQRQIVWGKIEKEFREILETTGLSLESVNGTITVFSEDIKIPESRMRVNIANPQAFIQYLSVLSLPLSCSQIYGLNKVARNLTLQLTREYKFDNLMDERILNLFSCLSKMITRYREIGLGNSVNDLAHYLEISRKGYIREYLLVERLNLFTEVGGNNFGPSQWQTDSNLKYFQGRWKQAVEAYILVSKNPKALLLAQSLCDRLKKSAEYAIRDLEDFTKIKHISGEDRKSFRKVIEEAMTGIQCTL